MVFKRTGFIQSREVMSRRDGILLTVDFNLRTGYASCALKSPTGTILLPPHLGRVGVGLVSSLQDLLMTCKQFFRRLKPTVNKVLSLRDISSLIQYFYKFFISRAKAHQDFSRSTQSFLANICVLCGKRIINIKFGGKSKKTS